MPDAPSAHDTGQFEAGGRQYPPQIARLPQDLQRATERSVLDRPGPATSCARTGNFGCLRDCGSCSRGVDLLGGRLGRGPEGCVVGDAVAVSVGGDHACGLAPGCGSSSVVGRRSKSLRPRCVLGECSFECGVGAGLDQFLPLVESGSHLGVDDSVRLWDEAGDESRWLASPSRACGAGGRALDTVVEDGGDVVGVDESARCDEARQEGIDVVMVGLGTAEFSRERPNASDSMALLSSTKGVPSSFDSARPSVDLPAPRRPTRATRRRRAASSLPKSRIRRSMASSMRAGESCSRKRASASSR